MSKHACGDFCICLWGDFGLVFAVGDVLGVTSRLFWGDICGGFFGDVIAFILQASEGGYSGLSLERLFLRDICGPLFRDVFAAVLGGYLGRVCFADVCAIVFSNRSLCFLPFCASFLGGVFTGMSLQVT